MVPCTKEINWLDVLLKTVQSETLQFVQFTEHFQAAKIEECETRGEETSSQMLA
jgi:hypothetical protein